MPRRLVQEAGQIAVPVVAEDHHAGSTSFLAQHARRIPWHQFLTHGDTPTVGIGIASLCDRTLEQLASSVALGLISGPRHDQVVEWPARVESDGLIWTGNLFRDQLIDDRPFSCRE
jgi:hypothetical protein